MYLFRLSCEATGFSPLNISEEPTGFDNLELITKRNDRYDGMSGEFAFDLTFCGAGGDYIRSVLLKLGILATDVFYIDIHKNARISENLILRGKILLTSFKESADGVSVSIVPTDDSFNFINRMDSEIDLFSKRKLGYSTDTLADLPTVTTLVPSPTYTGLTSMNVGVGDLVGCYSQDISNVTGTLLYEQFFSKLCPITVHDDLFLIDSDNVPNGNYAIFKSTFNDSVDICFEGELVFGVAGIAIDGISVNCGLYGIFDNIRVKLVYKINGTVITTIFDTGNIAGCIIGYNTTIDCNSASNYTVAIPISFTVTQTLYVGDLLAFQIIASGDLEISNTPDPSRVIYISKVTAPENTYLSVKRSITENPHNVETLFSYDAFQRISSIISDKNVVSDTFAYDNLTNTYGSSGNSVLCNGLMLRNAPLVSSGLYDTCFVTTSPSTEPRWAMSFSKLFDNLSKVFCLGMEINEDVRIERKAYFYRYELAHKRFNINTVSDKFQLSFIDREVYSKFSFGYSNYDDQHYSLREDLFCDRNYSTILTQTDAEWDGKCEFVASPQTIVRQKIAEEEADFDSETFIMMSWGLPQRVQQNTYAIVSDMLYDDLFNMPITPIQNWQRWAKFLTRATLQGSSAKLNTGFGNTSACYTNDDSLLPNPINQLLAEDREYLPYGTSICENRPLENNNAMQIFAPFEISFQHKICFESYKEILSKKYGLIEIQLDTKARVLQGWINSISYNPLTGLAKFKLIASNPLYYNNAVYL